MEAKSCHFAVKGWKNTGPTKDDTSYGIKWPYHTVCIIGGTEVPCNVVNVSNADYYGMIHEVASWNKQQLGHLLEFAIHNLDSKEIMTYPVQSTVPSVRLVAILTFVSNRSVSLIRTEIKDIDKELADIDEARKKVLQRKIENETRLKFALEFSNMNKDDKPPSCSGLFIWSDPNGLFPRGICAPCKKQYPVMTECNHCCTSQPTEK